MTAGRAVGAATGPPRRISRSQLAEFCDYLAVMLDAGLTLSEGVDECALSHDRDPVGRFSRALAVELRSGSSITAAVASSVTALPALFRRLVAAGERSGGLARALQEAGSFLREGERSRSAVLGAAAYPLVVLLMVVGFMVALQFLFVPGALPSLMTVSEPVLARLGAIRRAARAEASLVVAVAVILPLVGAAAARLRSEDGASARLADRLLLAVPLLGKLVLARELRLFVAALDSFIRGDLSVEAALYEASDLVRSPALRGAIQAAAGRIEAGCPASRAVAEDPLIPERIRRAIAIGDRTGSLTGVLPPLVEHYRWETERLLRRFRQLVEPFLIGVCGMVVVVLVLTVFLPLFALFGESM